MRSSTLLTKLLFAAMALAVFFFSYYLGNRYARPGGSELLAFPLPAPERIRPFRLVDKRGQSFTRAELLGHWNFMMAGNLEEEACRPLLARYVFAWNWLATDPQLQRKTRVVFLHTGPELPAKRLAALIDRYNPAFEALQGDRDELAQLARQIGISAEAIGRHLRCDPQNSVVALINPEGYLLALFTAVTDPAAIARDLRFFQ